VNLISFSENNPIIDFGITVKRSSIRQCPNNTPVLDENGFDIMQECALLPSKPVIILDKIGMWYFIQAENCAGWTLFDNIGIVNKKTFEDFITNNNYYIVTDSVIEIDNVQYFMSSRLIAEGLRKIKIPYLNKTFAEWKTVPVCEGVHKGYLPFTRANIISQAVKLLGYPYDWGEKNGSVDCSALTMYVYACCGVKIPRNSSRQAEIEGPVHVYENTESALPGDIIHNPGHVMIYLDEGLVLHASYSNGKVLINRYT